jgi:hypothetical protein
VVEDPFIQRYLRTVLSRRGYRVEGSDLRSVIEILSTAPDRIDLVITNSPLAFLAFERSLPLLYIAGAPDFDLAAHFSHCRVLRKPFHPEELVDCVKELTGSL